MKKFIFTIAAVAAMFVSCSQYADLEIVDNYAKSEAITLVNASSVNGTRAVVSGNSINWQSGDKLGVLGTNASAQPRNTAYTLSRGQSTTSGTFANAESEITAISAIMYPYQENASYNAATSNLTLEIPFLQTGVKGSFDPKAAIMYALGGTTDQTLSLAVNFLKVTVSEANVHSITISSTTTALSGKMEVTGSGVVAASDGTLNSVTLTAGKGNCFEAGDYYIAVKAGDIMTPSVSYVYYDNSSHTATEKTKAGSGTLEFNGKNVRTISANFEGGTVTVRKAVQLWADGPYFAEYNIGATSATEDGDYYTWGGSVNTSNSDQNNGTAPLWGATDTATKKWGGNWRMPTAEELKKLVNVDGDNCEIQWVNKLSSLGYDGYSFTGKYAGYESNSVFLPAAGYYGKDDNGVIGFHGVHGHGHYRSSTPGENSKAYSIYFRNDKYEVTSNDRSFARSVRAVLAD